MVFEKYFVSIQWQLIFENAKKMLCDHPNDTFASLSMDNISVSNETVSGSDIVAFNRRLIGVLYCAAKSGQSTVMYWAIENHGQRVV